MSLGTCCAVTGLSSYSAQLGLLDTDSLRDLARLLLLLIVCPCKHPLDLDFVLLLLLDLVLLLRNPKRDEEWAILIRHKKQ
jgi:hypothetical protein